MRGVLIGEANGERVCLRRLTGNGPESWFDVEVEIHCDGWHGQIRASFMGGELSRFANEVEILYEQLAGEAILDPVEDYLTLSFKGDGKGHVEIQGMAQNHLGSGTQLSFRLEIDQTFLPAIARSLRDLDSLP